MHTLGEISFQRIHFYLKNKVLLNILGMTNYRLHKQISKLFLRVKIKKGYFHC